jgi:hypothetical protein
MAKTLQREAVLAVLEQLRVEVDGLGTVIDHAVYREGYDTATTDLLILIDAAIEKARG